MSKLFLGGVPADIDVRKLREAFPSISEGEEITHDQVEGVLGIGRDKNRYRTVTGAWRKALVRDHGQELEALAGIGFRCLNAAERVNGGVKRFERGTRQQMRAVKATLIVRTDDPVLIKTQDVMRRAGAAAAAQFNSVVKEIEPPKSSQQMPRLVRGAGQ